MPHNPPRIGVIVIPIDAYWVQTLETIQQTNRQLGDDLVIMYPATSNEELFGIQPEVLVDHILAQRLDALITGMTSYKVYEALQAFNIPVIHLSEVAGPRFRSNAASMSSLYPAGQMAGRYIAAQLKGQGHAVCIDATATNLEINGQTRKAGFLDALQAYPQISSGVIPCYWNFDAAYICLQEKLKEYPQRIDAIFGASDPIVLAAAKVGREQGILPPDAVLVGVNGDPLALASIQSGEISATIDISSETLGHRAMLMAHGAALGAELPPEIPQEFALITRDNVHDFAMRKLAAVAHIPDRMVGYNRERIQTRLSQLEISMEITRQIGALQEREKLVQVVSKLVSQHYGYEWMRILGWSQEEQAFTHYGGAMSPCASRVPLEQDELLQEVIRSGSGVQIPDKRYSYRWNPGPEWEEIVSRAVLPIERGNETVGILDLQSARPITQPSFEFVGLQLLASQLGIVMQNVELYLEALKSREAAEHANQLKNRLIANVGHEMRTPLNTIMGFSQAIQKQIKSGQPPPSEQLQQDIRHIYNSGEHLMYMINDLLDLSRAEIGALSLYFEQLNPGPFLREVFESFYQSGAPNPEVAWRMEVPERLPVIRADVIRLRQILVNLLANARKFTPRGSVTLGAQVEPPYLHLWVRDTGGGVPLEFQRHIFEPFSTVARKRRAEGIGLGLSITRHLVALHNGMITLESQPEQGSQFHIYLPLPGFGQEPLPHSPANAQALMLIISTNRQVPEDLARICAGQQLTPQPVATREELAQTLLLGKPRVIAWDLATASANEWLLLHQLSQEANCSALPILLYAGSEDQASSASGLTDVVFKPCQENIILEWLEHSNFETRGEQVILVVDDDPQARAHYTSLLSAARPQARLQEAQNGHEALEQLKTLKPALILLDLVMPEVDGFAVLEAVRRDPRTQRVPVIIVSGKLLNFEDIQRLNHLQTIVLTKELLDDNETLAYLEASAEATKALPQPTSILVKQVIAFIHQNFARPLKRADMADAVGVSDSYLSQIFRQEVSLSPMDYLTRLRIQKSKNLLTQSNHSVTAISSLVGFNDSAYFSRVFHKLNGCSPQEFRRKQAQSG